MLSEFSVISELKTIKEEKNRLSERESELSKALLSDLSLISDLYEWFNEIQANRNRPVRPGGSKFKKQFVFIIMFLYSPGTLAGGKIGKGIRDVLANVLGFKAPTAISNLCTDVMFLYSNYKDFRRDINCIYVQILERLKIEIMNGIK